MDEVANSLNEFVGNLNQDKKASQELNFIKDDHSKASLN